MKRFTVLFQCIVMLALALSTATPALAKDGSGFQAGFYQWRGHDGGFDSWETQGTLLASFQVPGGPSIGPMIMLDFANTTAGTDSPLAYYGHNFYNGSSYLVGEATSPELTTSFAFNEAIASWDALTPDNTWIETLMRAKIGETWTKWYNMGVWASWTGTVERHSVRLQGDANGYVAVDTLVLARSKLPATALQVKVRLFSATGTASPEVLNMAVTYSTGAPKKAATSSGSSANWNTLVDVPQCSQMVYPDGGNVWCSPTSTSMVLGYWGMDPGPCEARVRKAVAGTYDWLYDGNGNWPFNTAYAASQGMEAYVVRFASLDALEAWVKAGVPVVMSIAWGKNDLTNAPIPSSSGHLIVLVGFDQAGNPIVNDPAAASNDTVRRTYLRQELESAWLTNSGGTVYLIYPAGWSIPEF